MDDSDGKNNKTYCILIYSIKIVYFFKCVKFSVLDYIEYEEKYLDYLINLEKVDNDLDDIDKKLKSLNIKSKNIIKSHKNSLTIKSRLLKIKNLQLLKKY